MAIAVFGGSSRNLSVRVHNSWSAGRHQFWITVQAAAVLFEEKGQLNLQQAEQVLYAWYQLNRPRDASQIPEVTVITIDDADILRQYLTH